ncbi:hypothetical protein PHJA_002611400 [Phtheirospermum japonicum]|uniref:Uncharacterized protein n=1 Tax=Phtheirospermum japonicum TaxID=374723 RepID=A0A830D8V6_9LAMI|nr:hypothetical protein PHJA_002611400 [Phtheirospermum japonicum]
MPGYKFPLLSRILTLFLLIFSHSLPLISSSIIPPPPPFNISHFLHPKVTTFTESNTTTQQPPYFLQGVLDAIAKKEKWALEDIRVLELEVKRAKYRSGLRYESRVRFGKAEIVLKMYEEMSEWKKLLALRKNGTLNFEALVRMIASEAVIDSFKIEGPFEMRVTRDDDRLSLSLPLNTTHSGLRQISVGEGITVEIKGAEQISMFHPSINPLPNNIFTYRDSNDVVGSLWPAICTALQSIRILGSASVIAYRNQRPTALIQTAFTSLHAIKLLPNKCYVLPYNETPRHVLSSLSIRIALLERVLRKFVNERGSKNTALGSVKTRIEALTVFRFQLGLERDIGVNDTFWSTLAEWRTRPTIERVSFEVVARIEGEVLKPLVVKKVRPAMDTDSFAWSSLSANISFTKFPSVLVPPEALTLDVKW